MKMLITTMAAVTLLLSGAAFAGHGHAKSCKSGFYVTKMTKKLSLNSTQQTQLKQIMTTKCADLEKIRAQMKPLKGMQAMALQDKADMQKLFTMADQQAALVAQKMKLGLQTNNKIYTMLDTQQKATFKSWMEKKAAMWKKRMKKHQ